MPAASDVIVVGSINADLVIRVPRLPRPGETVSGYNFKVFGGGKGANQALAVARLGAKVRLIGNVGTDDFGAMVIKSLASGGVNVSLVEWLPEAHTGVALIMVDESGENAIATAPGANRQWATRGSGYFRNLFQTCHPYTTVILQLEIPLEIVEEVTAAAQEYGLRVILNPAPARPVGDDLLRRADVITPNRHEASELSQVKITDLESAREAARVLLERGVGCVVVTLGGEGAVVATRAGTFHAAPFDVRAVDCTAAGDAFTGGLAVALSEGLDLLSAVKFANACGAIAVTKEGAQPSMPTRVEVEELLRSQSPPIRRI